MKRIKKFASVLLALVMMLALSVPAFAANLADGETYTAYKIFDATISGDNASYSIANGSEWLNVVQNYTGTGLTLTQSADGTKYVVTAVTEGSNAFDATAFAAYLATATSDKRSAGSGTASNGTVTLNLTDDGYYLITSSLGSICQLVTGGEITINEKNKAPTVDKVIETDDAYAQIGDVIPFTVTITDGTGTNKAITLHDQMSNALTLNVDSFKVQVNGTDVVAGNYELKTGDDADTGDTFTIVFAAGYIASLDANAEIVVTYNATLNENAITVDSITNKASIDYSNQDNTSEEEVEIKTNSFAVLKYAATDAEKSNLAGATFQLKQGNTVISLIKLSDTEYRVAMPDEQSAVETFTTVDSGSIVIKGVDSDLTYALVETVAPDGYNLLTDDVDVNIDADNSTVIEVENESGTSLPITGGMGTTVLYVLGTALVLGAGVLLVVRRRMNADK